MNFVIPSKNTVLQNWEFWKVVKKYVEKSMLDQNLQKPVPKSSKLLRIYSENMIFNDVNKFYSKIITHLFR